MKRMALPTAILLLALVVMVPAAFAVPEGIEPMTPETPEGQGDR